MKLFACPCQRVLLPVLQNSRHLKGFLCSLRGSKILTKFATFLILAGIAFSTYAEYLKIGHHYNFGVYKALFFCIDTTNVPSFCGFIIIFKSQHILMGERL